MMMEKKKKKMKIGDLEGKHLAGEGRFSTTLYPSAVLATFTSPTFLDITQIRLAVVDTQCIASASKPSTQRAGLRCGA